MSSLPPNPRQGFAGLSATGTLTDPNQDPSFITPPGTGGFDKVALLKAKLDDAEKKIQQIQDKGTMVVCAPSQRSIKDRQNQEVKNIVRTIIQTEIWNEVKFVCNDNEAKMVTLMSYDHFKEQIPNSSLEEDEFVYYYATFVMTELNKIRTYVSGRSYKAYKNFPSADPKPTVLELEECLKRTINPTNPRFFQVFNWYMDKLLPLNTGTGTMFGESVRHYQTISMASPPGDALASSITIETEAYAVLNYENNLTKWEYYDTVLDDNYSDHKYKPCNRTKEDEQKVDYEVVKEGEKSILRIYKKECRGKYTKADCGQSRYGGWTRAGLERYKALCTLAEQGRKSPNCEKLEEASLKQVRINHGKSAKTYEEEQNNKRKKPESSGPVDDNFTTFRFPKNRPRKQRAKAKTTGMDGTVGNYLGNDQSNVAKLPPINYNHAHGLSQTLTNAYPTFNYNHGTIDSPYGQQTPTNPGGPMPTTMAQMMQNNLRYRQNGENDDHESDMTTGDV